MTAAALRVCIKVQCKSNVRNTVDGDTGIVTGATRPFHTSLLQVATGFHPGWIAYSVVQALQAWRHTCDHYVGRRLHGLPDRSRSDPN